MLYRTIKKLIERGLTVGLDEKYDVFYAADKMAQGEYDALIGMLAAGPAPQA